MFFMGDEFAASSPFLYFCDFGPELASAVAEGRRAEFGGFAVFADEAARARIPDPNANETFLASKLRWRERGTQPHFARLCEVQKLLDVRQRHLVPHFAGARRAGSHRCEEGVIRVGWELAGKRLHLIANFGAQQVLQAAVPPGAVLYSVGAAADAEGLRLERGAVHATLEEIEQTEGSAGG